jgi:hypothetical protein
MSMAITSRGVPFTHYLELRGNTEKELSREELDALTEEKIKEIDKAWHPDIELIYVKDKTFKVGVLLSMTCTNETVLTSAKTWVDNHIKGKVPGIVANSLMIKTVFDMGLSTPFKEEVIKI